MGFVSSTLLEDAYPPDTADLVVTLVATNNISYIINSFNFTKL